MHFRHRSLRVPSMPADLDSVSEAGDAGDRRRNKNRFKETLGDRELAIKKTRASSVDVSSIAAKGGFLCFKAFFNRSQYF